MKKRREIERTIEKDIHVYNGIFIFNKERNLAQYQNLSRPSLTNQKVEACREEAQEGEGQGGEEEAHEGGQDVEGDGHQALPGLEGSAFGVGDGVQLGEEGGHQVLEVRPRCQ